MSLASQCLLRCSLAFVLMVPSVLPTCKHSRLLSSTRCSTFCRRTSTWPALRRQRARSVSRSVPSGRNGEITASDHAASHLADRTEMWHRRKQEDPILLVSARGRTSEQGDA
jgi:hypothetical protein